MLLSLTSPLKIGGPIPFKWFPVGVAISHAAPTHFHRKPNNTYKNELAKKFSVVTCWSEGEHDFPRLLPFRLRDSSRLACYVAIYIATYALSYVQLYPT